MGRATVEAVLRMSAEHVAGPKEQGRRDADRELYWHGVQAGRVALKDGSCGRRSCGGARSGHGAAKRARWRFRVRQANWRWTAGGRERHNQPLSPESCAERCEAAGELAGSTVSGLSSSAACSSTCSHRVPSLRYYGFLANDNRQHQLAECRRFLLAAPLPGAERARPATTDPRDLYEASTGRPLRRCPRCHDGSMQAVDHLAGAWACPPTLDSS